MHKLNWDDLRFVLAVADTGSVNAAAKVLGVNHATVLRRIASFEESCGGPVFERDRSGYRLRPNRAPVIEAARLAAQHVKSAEALMQGRQNVVGKTLRITSTDSFCQTVLAWIYPALARRVAPDRLTYLSSNRMSTWRGYTPMSLCARRWFCPRTSLVVRSPICALRYMRGPNDVSRRDG